MTWHRIRTIFAKEVVDNLRDYRTVITALIFPLLGPTVLGLTVMLTGKVVGDTLDKSIELPVAGAEHAPNLIAFLEQNRVEVVKAPLDPKDAVLSKKHDAVLIIPPEFGEQLASGQPASVQLMMDESNRSTKTSVGYASRLVYQYGRQIGLQRLVARGVSPVVTRAIVVEEIDLSTPRARAMIVLGMMPLFIVIAVFMGGFYIALDTTVGERERGSLEPLLINPVARWEFVVAKLGATWVFTASVLALSVASFATMVSLVPVEGLRSLDIRLELNFLTALGLLGVTLPLTFFASTAQMLVAAFCRTFKEAQTYVSLLMMVPIFPALILTMLPVKTELWMLLIPTLSEQLLILGLLRGDGIDPLHWLVAAVSTSVLSGLLLTVVIRLYRGERVLLAQS